MPMSSEKFATLHSTHKKKSVWNCFSIEEEGDSLAAYFNDAWPTVSNLSPCLWFHVGLQIPVCIHLQAVCACACYSLVFYVLTVSFSLCKLT